MVISVLSVYSDDFLIPFSFETDSGSENPVSVLYQKEYLFQISGFGYKKRITVPDIPVPHSFSYDPYPFEA